MIRKAKLFMPKTAADDIELKRHATLKLENIDIFVKKAIESFENLASVGNERETIALLTESNAFANDLEVLVYKLTQIVIKTFKGGHSSPDVMEVAKTFSTHVYSLQKTFNVDINELKRELKLGLESASVEARRLHDLLETEPTYRNDLLIILGDLLVLVKKVNFRNIFETKTAEELKNIEEEAETIFINAVDKISDKVDDALLNMILMFTYHGIRHMGPIVHTLDEDAEGYDEIVKSSLEQIAFNISENLAVLNNAIRAKDGGASIKDHLKVIIRSCHTEMISLTQFYNPYSSNEKLSVNLNNLILLLLAHHLSMAYHIIEGLGLGHTSIE